MIALTTQFRANDCDIAILREVIAHQLTSSCKNAHFFFAPDAAIQCAAHTHSYINAK